MTETFHRMFGRPPDVAARAPGRVNLIGEHTDYNGGYVLPTVLPQTTSVLLGRRADDVIRAVSVDLAQPNPLQYTLGAEQRTGSWIDYVQGVTRALRDEGHRLAGCDLLVASTVPIGKGVSSSASLEVAVGRALRTAFGLRIDDVGIAMAGHRAETEFVGAPVGIMDQMVCSLGDASSALFLDARTRAFDRIPMPPAVELGVIDSGIAHAHASGDYRVRRRECEEAARALGVGLLRDIEPGDPRIDALPPPLDRRARHVVSENARVLAAVAAMKRSDARTLGRLLMESHASMRDDFQVSLPDIDRLVDLAANTHGVLGARLTGGGFGGAIVVLCEKGTSLGATRSVLQRYQRATQHIGGILLPAQTYSAA